MNNQTEKNIVKAVVKAVVKCVVKDRRISLRLLALIYPLRLTYYPTLPPPRLTPHRLTPRRLTAPNYSHFPPVLPLLLISPLQLTHALA